MARAPEGEKVCARGPFHVDFLRSIGFSESVFSFFLKGGRLTKMHVFDNWLLLKCERKNVFCRGQNLKKSECFFFFSKNTSFRALPGFVLVTFWY